jgi:cytochrome b
MSVMQKLRAYHAVLGVLVVLAYLTGEAGLIHLVLGYAIAALIIGRLLAAFSGMPQLGLSRFYPQFEGLTLNTAATHPAISKTLLAGIAAALIAATVTGIQLDRTQVPRQAASALVAPATIAVARADSDRERTASAPGERRGEREREGGSDDMHEFFANLLMLLVGLHVAYLLLFKRSLARFMLFLSPPRPPVVAPGAAE